MRSASLSAKGLSSAPEVVNLIQRVRQLEEENSQLRRGNPNYSPGTFSFTLTSTYNSPFYLSSSRWTSLILVIDALIEINDLKIKLAEQTAAATRYRNERNQLIKVVQKTSGVKPFASVENTTK